MDSSATTGTPTRWTPADQSMTFLPCNSVTGPITLKVRLCVQTQALLLFLLQSHEINLFLHHTRTNPGIKLKSGLNLYPLNPAGVDGRFWYVKSSGLVCSDGEVPEDFSLELQEHGRVAIRGKNGKYLRGDPGGTLKGDGVTPSSWALWEY